MENTSTSLLLRLRQSDDREAWSRFVELYTPLIFYWGRKAGLQSHDASDLVQEVLTVMVRKLPEFEYDQSKSFRGWLRTVTLNKWRERNRRRSLAVVDVTESQLADVIGVKEDDFWEVEYRQQLVRRALELMKSEFQPTTWHACYQYVISGRPADEVAREAGISVWTVYSAKSKLLRRLREELDGMLD